MQVIGSVLVHTLCIDMKILSKFINLTEGEFMQNSK